jgi:RNAse (barnase) inhibitor barstar
MKELILDGKSWKNDDDVYDAFFHAAGAPPWHGRNFNALRDSISTGSINQVEVPYRLVIKNYDRIGSGAKEMADDLIDLIHELAAQGCTVEVRVEASGGGNKRSRIQQRRLDEMEADFQSLLLPALKQCAAGRWGLFGQNENLEAAIHLRWDQADHLRQSANQIHVLRKEFGQPNPLVERFLYYSSLRGANVPGETRLAQTLLDEIASGLTMK